VIRVADLLQEPHHLDPLEFEDGVWIRMMDTIRSLGFVDAETMDRMASLTRRFELTREQARKLGSRLEVWLIKDMSRKAEPPPPPVIPPYIVPIAASNGVWIDPALPLLHRKPDSPQDQLTMDLFRLTFLCLNCSGFSVN
jgi:hypothetical protein